MVAPNLAAFRRDYPEVELELVVTSQGIDLRRDQVDVAVVVGPQEDSELISRKLFAGRLVWVTSPPYLRDNAVGNTLEQLRGHIQLCEKRYGLSRMPVRVNGQAGFIDLEHGITHVNDPLTVRRALLGGAGVSLMPELYCRQQLREGSLCEVASHISFDRSASVLSIVYPGRRLMSPRVRAFIAFLDRIVAGR